MIHRPGWLTCNVEAAYVEIHRAGSRNGDLASVRQGDVDEPGAHVSPGIEIGMPPAIDESRRA